MSKLSVTVSGFDETEDNPVPPAIVTVSPSVTASVVPVFPVKLNEVAVPTGVPQVLSPRKKVVALAVPVADRSPLIVPVVVIGPPVMSTKVPELVATEVSSSP